jgi:hypothetical protein
MAQTKILAISFAFNEINFIKLKKQWCKNENIDLYIIDNISNDGTWECLLEQGISCHQFDTNGEFHLNKLQDELIKTVHAIKPDWIIYMGADEFLFSPNGIRKDIEEADRQGYTVINNKTLNFHNTGENSDLHMFEKFFYYSDYGTQVRIKKYSPNISLWADYFVGDTNIKKSSGFCLVNYGDTKTAAEREETLKRREKAWANNLDKNFGNHYVKGKAKNWIWDKTELIDIRTTNYSWVLQKLKELKSL